MFTNILKKWASLLDRGEYLGQEIEGKPSPPLFVPSRLQRVQTWRFLAFSHKGFPALATPRRYRA